MAYDPAAKVISGNTRGTAGQPAIAVSGNNVYVVWSESTSRNDHILLRSSADGGGTFGSIINLSNNPGNYAFPAIAASGNNVYVVWYVVWVDSTHTDIMRICEGADTNNILFRSSADGGGTFGITISLSNNSARDYVFPVIAVS
jgi:hypothetical protein